ncbi:MAG TPA: TetR/AcrR family transcriptional regulator [Acidimicrobiales bacterium]
MATNEPAAESPPPGRPVSWRDQAVARSLDSARVRAEKRVQRFLDAALELMNSDSGREFTVQEVVERSGQSLRSFYQYFAGKHELLLALFEESVRATAERLEELIAREDDALARLRRFTVEYHRLCRPTPAGKVRAGKAAPTPAMADFAQRLLTEHPKEAAQAFVPLVSLLERVLDEAAAAGAVRPGLHHRRIAGIVLQAISFDAFSSTISGSSVRAGGGAGADDLWDLLLHGVGAEGT